MQEFRAELEGLSRPNGWGFDDIKLHDLKHVRTALEGRIVKRRLSKPILQMAPDDGDMEEDTHTNGTWELHIINHLMVHRTNEEGSVDSASDFEPGDLGNDKDEPTLEAKYRKEKRDGKQREKQDGGKALSWH